MRYYIITGEPSGDIHAANLLKELKKIDSNTIVRAWGGERLISEGVSLAKNIVDTAFMGLWSVFKNFRTISSNLIFCKKDIISFNPDALILVDYPGFNLKIAEFAKKNNIKVFYYISPKVWAWNKNRIIKIKKFIDHMIVIFPFEVDFYKKNGVEVSYFGNPILDEIENRSFSFSIKSSQSIIALLPGSRKQEIDTILPKMLSIIKNYPNFQFIIAGTNSFTKNYYQSIIKNHDVSIVFNETFGLLANSKCALVASGTATLEVALLNVPQVVCYKTNWLTYFFARNLLNIKYISLVNIILNREVVKELIQYDLNKENLIRELDLAINQCERLLINYKKLSVLLNKNGASKNVANLIFSSC